jgi:hypothetical protein
MDSQSSEIFIPLKKEDLQKMTDKELGRLWKERWKGSQNQFAREYHLNQGNFSRWLQGKKDSMKSVRAVFLFLMGEGPGYDLPSDTIPPREYVYRGGPREDVIQAFQNSAISLEQMLSRITSCSRTISTELCFWMPISTYIPSSLLIQLYTFILIFIL